jgi:hypothetical protein
MLRPFRPEDLPQLREIHARAGYQFELPETFESAYVMEDGGRVVALAGAEVCAHVFMVIDPTWGSPHQRMELIESFHWPVSADLLKRGIQYAFIWCEPRFKSFARRMRSLGWVDRVWPCLSISQAEVAKRLKEAAHAA